MSALIKAKQIDIPSLIVALNLTVTIRSAIGLTNGLTWTTSTGIGELGGTLTKNTTIAGAGYIFQIQNSSTVGSGEFHISSTKTSTTESSSVDVFATYTKVTTAQSSNNNNLYIYYNKIIANTNLLQFQSTNLSGNSSHQIEFLSLTSEVVAKIIAYRGASSSDHELRFNVNTYKFLNDAASTTYWWVDSTGFYLPSLTSVALGTDSNGKLVARNLTSDVTNGITIVTSKYGLGGSLIQNTSIALGGFSFSLTDTNYTYTFNDEVFFDSGNSDVDDSGQFSMDLNNIEVTSLTTLAQAYFRTGDGYASLYNVAPFNGSTHSMSMRAEANTEKSEVYVHYAGVVITSNQEIRLNCTNIYTGLISVGVLGTDSNGKLISQAFSLLLTNDDVTNGIQLITGKIGLGGTLTQNTSVALSSYTLSFGSNYLYGNGNVTLGINSDLSARLGLRGTAGGTTFLVQNDAGTQYFKLTNDTKSMMLGDGTDYWEWFVDTTTIAGNKFPRLRAYSTAATDNGGLTIESYASSTAAYAAMRFIAARRNGAAISTNEYAFSFTSPSMVHLAVIGQGHIYTNVTDGNFFIGYPLGTDVVDVKLQVNGGISFTDELIVNSDPGTIGQILYSQGAGVSPIWDDLVIEYGERINKSGTSETLTAPDWGGGNNVLGFTNVAARAVTLPLATAITGRIVWLVDEAGTAASANITISTTGGNTILGGSSIVISENYGSVGIYSDGSSKWFVV